MVKEIWHKAYKNIATGDITVQCGKSWLKVGISVDWEDVNCKDCLKEES